MTRRTWVMTTCVAALGAGLSALFHPAPRLIWNASASVPIGLYVVRPAGALRVGELLVVTAPKPLAAFLAERGYLPRGVPLLKHVAALAGQSVCRVGRTITVDGVVTGRALERDRRGRQLPVWRGCLRIGAGDVFVMNRPSADSLDSRYFGPLLTTTIVGRADPLWLEKGR